MKLEISNRVVEMPRKIKAAIKKGRLRKDRENCNGMEKSFTGTK